MEIALLILGVILVLNIVGIRLLAWRVEVRWEALRSSANCPSCRYDGTSVTPEGRCVECGRTRAESLERLGHAPVWPLAVILVPALVLAMLPFALFPEWATRSHVRYLVAALLPSVALALVAWWTRIVRFPGLAWTFVLIPSLLMNAVWAWSVLAQLRPRRLRPGAYPYEIEALASLPPILHVTVSAASLGLFYCIVAGWLGPRRPSAP